LASKPRQPHPCSKSASGVCCENVQLAAWDVKRPGVFQACRGTIWSSAKPPHIAAQESRPKGNEVRLVLLQKNTQASLGV
jgi:hypothetical protein